MISLPQVAVKAKIYEVLIRWFIEAYDKAIAILAKDFKYKQLLTLTQPTTD
ncbi:MAG: hypothetical protein F6K28_15195 [Microcoleus sp. SIO2G3]|nr:hypothetical protein [Microcoleus sp. SIO2G3]